MGPSAKSIGPPPVYFYCCPSCKAHSTGDGAMSSASSQSPRNVSGREGGLGLAVGAMGNIAGRFKRAVL